MNRRLVATIFLIICCIALLLASYFVWKGKLKQVSAESTTESPLKKDPGVVLAAPIEVEIPEDLTGMSSSELAVLLTNMDDEIAAILKNRMDSGLTVQLLIAGSQALSQGGIGASGLFQQQLKNAYGDFINVDVVAFQGTSKEFIEEMDQQIDWSAGYDIILYEPFTLNNNGKVIIEEEHRHLSAFKEKAQKSVEDAGFIVMPPQPIFKPSFYLKQIQSLEKYTTRLEIPYINHWENWPDITSVELSTFLAADSSPNVTGAAAWSAALEHYFIPN